MKITRVRLTQFRVPFVRPYVTAAGVAEAREGVIVRLDTDAGVTGVGESSLLPHEGPPDEMFLQLSELCSRLAGAPMRQVIDQAIPGPAWAGVETAAWDADSRGDSKPLSRWMWSNAATFVAVNALVITAEVSGAVEGATKAVRDGFGTVKLKVGVAPSAQDEVTRIRAVYDALPAGCRLRLDANGAWDEPAALEVLSALAGMQIEYIEQPIAPGNLPAMRRLRAASPVPIAVDEEISNPPSARAVFEAGAADVVVLKPIALGGLQATYSIRGQAIRAGVETAITTSIDTGIGTALALHIAAGTESRFAAGLATAHLLESDLLLEPLLIESGQIQVPQRPGLGVELDEPALRRYAIREWESEA